MLFKKKIKTLINRKIKEIHKNQSQVQQLQFDYAQISKLFNDSSFIPFTGWSMSPTTILHILNDIVINNRQHIIEFGSGMSTLYIAKLIQTNRLTASFYSVESDKDWMDKMKSDLKNHHLEDVVTFIYAPLTEVPSQLGLSDQKLWYDTKSIDKVLNNHTVDLIIVDGPLGKSTPYARYSAVPFIINRLEKKYSVFLDDFKRPDELVILEEWSKLLNEKPKRNKRHAYFTTNKDYSTKPFKVN